VSETVETPPGSLPCWNAAFGHNVPVGKHSGEQVEEKRHIPHLRRMLAHAAGITVTLVAWGFLVGEAIDFGGKARNGESGAWLFLVLATLGATACLLLTLILGNQLRLLLRGEHPAQLSRSSGGRRVAR
jgi:hypothetical protein